MATINGTNNSDTLVGTSQNDTISGGNGNDTIDGGGGNDTLDGGNGDDIVAGGLGNDTITGGNGADQLTGGDGDDNIDGGNDNDTIDGGIGNDTLAGGNGNDIIAGGSGNNKITGGNGADQITTGDGNDTIDGGNDNDTIVAGGGNDIILGGNGADQITAGDGNDTLDGGNDNDTIDGGIGDDIVTGGNGNDTLDGGAGSDRIVAGNGDDIIIHRASENVGTTNIYEGGNGNDTLRLIVSSAIAGTAAFQADLALFNAGAGNGTFNSLNFTYTSFNKVEVVVQNTGNQAPTDIALTANTVAENAAGATIGTLSTVDPDAGNTHSYTVSDSRFEVVNGNTLKLKTGVSLDFESTPSINVNVTSTDAGGLFFTEAFTISVTNVNEVPTDIVLVGNTVAENAVGATVGTLSTVDPDAGNTHSYTVSDSRFEVVNGNTLKLKTGVSLDFESTPSINVNVTSTDAGGLFFTEAFTIGVTNVNEVPTDIVLVGNTVAENAAGATIGTLSTVDPDAGNTHSYTVSDDRFEVDGNILKLKAGETLDFETEATVVVDVTSTDGDGLSVTEDFTINVTNANDAPDSISLSASAVNEDTPGAVIGTLTGTDVDLGHTDTLTFSVADSSSPFEVVGNQGSGYTLKLKDGVSLDWADEFEVLVTVTATDSLGASFDRGFTITVNNGKESQAIDGYIAGATVFADANDNGLLDSGEATTTTDAFGNFTLFNGSGALVMFGGRDISTDHDFLGVMRAPEGSSVVTPLTTLVVAIAEATAVATGNPIDFATANSQLLEGLGLSAGTDLSTFDPIAATLSSDPTAQAQGQAAMAAAVQIQNTIVQAASLLEGAGGSFADAAAAVVAELAVQINDQANNNLTVDLNSSSVIQSVITEAASNIVVTDPQAVADAAAGAANVISSSNNVIEAAVTSGQTGEELLTTLAQVSVVAQGEASTALGGAGAGTTDISTVESNFTGTNLTDAVDDAPVGDVVGVNGDDIVTGDESANLLEGFGGNDTLIGNGGNDVLDGGDGNDTLDGGDGRDRATYVAATGAITVNLAAGTVTGAGVGSDTLLSVEQVSGSSFGDSYVATGFGQAGAVNIGSNGATNSFEGMGGNDTITGNGNTQISYKSATAGVTVDIALGTATSTGLDASIGADEFTGVFGVVGSQFVDILSGSNSGNIEQFNGGAGDDIIDGRGGNDRANYSAFVNDTVTGGVTINMAAGTVTGDASVGTDTLRAVEFIRGSNFADTYNATNFGAAGFLNPAVNNVGSNGTFNEIEGMGGNDAITGNGNTRITFANATAGVTVDLAAGTAMGDASVGSDTLFGGINSMVGSQFGDTFSGSNNAAQSPVEQFDGRAGDDSFDGRGGFDQAVYSIDSAVTIGISVTMAAGTVIGDAAVGTDTLRSIESVRGTNFVDIYDATGWATAGALNIGNLGTIGAFGGSMNEFEGQAGNDIITGSGDTRINFSQSTGGVTVDLAAGGANGQTGTASGNASVGTDAIFGGVARVRGSNNNDTISGDSFANNLEGQGGNDRLDGRGGDDLLTGGGGADTFVYANGGGKDNIIDFNRLQGDKIDLSGVAGMFNLAAVQAIASASGNGTIINFGGFVNTLFLSNIAPGSLLVSDFIFGHPPTDIALSNSAVAENSSNGTVVGTLSATDADAGETFTFSLLDDAGGRFAISGNNLVVTGTQLDFESAASHPAFVRVADTAGNSYVESFTIGVTNVNEPPAVALLNTVASIDENTAVGGGIKVADIAVTDDALGAETLTLSGADAASFAIVGGELRYTGASPDFEAKSSYSVTVNVNDESLGLPGSVEASQNFTLTINDLNDAPVNQAPTAVSFANTTTAIDENVADGGGIKVADIVVTDDALGTETLSLTGADAASFTIVGSELRYIGASPDFEAKSSYSVTVNANDESLGLPGSVEASQNFTLAVNDVNEAPTAVSFVNTTPAIDENVAVGGGIKVADIIVTDDALGTETLSLTGADAASFSIVGSELRYVGASPDFEAKSSYSVTVNANDESLGLPGSVESSQAFTLTVNDVNEAPTAVSFANTTTAIDENTPVGGGIKVADIVVTDDALGTETLSLSGADAASFAIVGNELRYTGLSPDFETKSSYTVTVNANDESLGAPGSVEASQTFVLTINDIAGLTVTGDAGNNTLNGSAEADTLQGLAGNDRLIGGAGADILDGGAGNGDFASYETSTSGLIVDLLTPSNNTGDAAGDSYIAVESLAGSAFNDTLRGDNANNNLEGGAGADTLDGGNGGDFASYQNAATDIVASLANTAVNTGDAVGDVYISIENLRGGAFNDTLTGNGSNNFLRGGVGADSLNGGGGTDTADYFNATTAIIVDLATPGNNTGEAAGDTFNSIENIRASNAVFDDTLRGNTGNNLLEGLAGNDTLEGGDGNDVLIGGLGADVLNGGAGNDNASYEDATAGVTADLTSTVANPLNAGEAAGDTYISVERLIGSAFNDILRGNTGNNFLEGGAGTDTLDGRGGNDYASYANAASAVTASLANPASNTGDAAGDTYIAIESLQGSNFNDTLIGDNFNNILRGGNGGDVLNGGGGNDTAEYTNATVGVTADLGNPGFNLGDAAGDTYISIENLNGSNNAGDTLRGDGLTNFLDGGTGNFADVLDGAGGNDYASYINSAVGVTVSLANPGVNTGDAAGDTYFNIEGIQGSNQADILTGDGNANFFRAGSGADVSDGGGGNDWVEYLNSQTGVTVNLDNPSLNLGADAIGDTYISIENLTGSNSGDTLIGDGGDNVLRGKTGADNLQGGGGFDTADYSTAPGAVVADLANSGLNTGDAAGDTYTSIENLRGWTFDDTLSGDGNGNFLDGQGGNDRLDGRGGIDLLFGSGGTDTFVFSAGEANGDTISDFFNPLEPAVGDALEFHGFGTAAQGATFTFIGAGQWQIHSGIGGPDEFITLTGSTAATVSSTDYIFLV